jgi:hypothetical protein
MESGSQGSDTYRLLADLILVLHFAVVAFIVGGLAAIWIGRWRGWRWVRNFWFRLAHLLAMFVVAVQPLLGLICPLTVWEWEMRQRAEQGRPEEAGFIEHWVHRLLYFDLPPAFFTALYIAFFAAVVWTWWAVRPRPHRSSAYSISNKNHRK